MVGVPRSTGCPLCVKRRVKCDETRPGCRNCAKYGAECLGYDKAFKFVAGKHQVRHRRQPANSCTSSDGGLLQAPSSGDTTPELSSPPTSTSIAQRETITPLTISPCESRSQFVYALLQNIDPNSDMGSFAPWFIGASERLGNNLTLDSAMSAFVIHLLGKANQDDVLVRRSRSIYGQSLGSLQKSLNHPVGWKSPETLCATMMMCYFELFAGTTDPDSWMKHAAGVSWLIQQRGPAAYSSPWDHSMLLSFRALIIMNAMFSGQDCFLAGRKWQQILVTTRPDDPGDTLQSKTDTIYDIYLAHMAKVPSILRHAVPLREARKHNMPVDAAHVALLSQHAEKLRLDFASWFESFEALNFRPTEAPSRDPGSIFETVLSYSNVWAGATYMGYWASMLILQETLNQCQYPVDYTMSNMEFARNIFRSVESVSVDILGPYRVGYPIRIAYEFADVRTQIWVTSLLAKFEKHYAATSSTTYPKPGPNEYQFE